MKPLYWVLPNFICYHWSWCYVSELRRCYWPEHDDDERLQQNRIQVVEDDVAALTVAVDQQRDGSVVHRGILYPFGNPFT